MLAEDILEIMDNFETESKKPFKDNEFASKVRNEFKNDFEKVLKEITSSDKYRVKFSVGRVTWLTNRNPWAGIRNIDATKSFKERFYIFFNIHKDGTGMDISLDQGLDLFKPDQRVEIADYLIKIFEESDFEIPMDFVTDDNRLSSESVMSRFFRRNEINTENLYNAIKELIPIYEYLIPYYNDFIKRYREEELMDGPDEEELLDNPNKVEQFIDDQAGDYDLNHEKSMWMIRAGRDAYLLNDFITKNIVAFGWDLGDLTDKSKEEIWKLVEEVYPNNKSQTNSIIVSQEIKFRDTIRKGDYVITSNPNKKSYYLGEITSDYQYLNEKVIVEEWDDGYDEIREVNWFAEIDKSDLKDSTQNTLGSVLGLFNINDDAKEDILNACSILEEKVNPENIEVWDIASGSSDVYDAAWDEFKKESYIGIGFNFTDDVDYSSFKDKESLENFVHKYDEKSLAPGMIWNFANNIKRGDIILAKKGLSKLAGIGICTGEFVPKTKNKNHNEFGLNNILPVKWFFTPDNLEIQNKFFTRHTVIKWRGSYWNPLMFILARTDEDLKSKILTYVYDSFAESDVLSHHNEIYDEEQYLVRNVWKKIENNYDNGLEIADAVWNEIIDREIKLHRDGTGNIKASIQGKTKFTDEEMDRVAVLLFETIRKLLDTDDIDEQKQILKDYCADEYSKGFRRTGRFSSILYNLSDSFYGINNKSVDTVELLSLILGDKLTLDFHLENYIETNEEYKKFLRDLGNAFDYDGIDISDFRTFDSFCHWACDKTLGNIAGKNADFLPFDLFVDINSVLRKADQENISRGISEENREENKEEDIERLNLTPELLQSKLQGFKVSPNSIKRICASLNAGKHIILNGTPGTGKTELALKFSNASKENKFCDGYVLTTATSDWSTFDTIGGLMPDENGELYFNQGKFLEAIALNKWLIIDEINRADIDKAFGQLFTVLSGQNVELPYKLNGKSVKIAHWEENRCKYDDETATYFIGKNWRIIGTMNVDDKDSLFDLSYAFMRRFMFIEIDLPDKEEYSRLVLMWARGLDEYYVDTLEYLIDLTDYRKLGPAIFKDMIEYIKVRKEFDSEENKKLILSESIDSYIIPQLEGLRKSQLKEIKSFLKDGELLEYLEEGIDELMPEY